MGDRHGARRRAGGVVAARERGIVRFIGVTGHGLATPRMHLRSLQRFPFDAVLLPMNYVLASDPRYYGDFVRLKTLCFERRVAVQLIKTVARRRGPAARAAAAPGTSRSTPPRTSPAPWPTP